MSSRARLYQQLVGVSYKNLRDIHFCVPERKSENKLRGSEQWMVVDVHKTHCAPMSCEVDTYGRPEKGATE